MTPDYKDAEYKRRLHRRYEIILDTRKFEIETYWKRSLFYWGFVATAFVIYGLLKTAEVENEKPLPALLPAAIAWFGLICSFAWTLVNRGSKYWQENWENLLDELDQEMTGNVFVVRDEKRIVSKKGVFKERQGAKRSDCCGWYWVILGCGKQSFSVSKVTILLSDFITLFWFAILCYELKIWAKLHALAGEFCPAILSELEICAMDWSKGYCFLIALVPALVPLGLMYFSTRSRNNDKNKHLLCRLWMCLHRMCQLLQRVFKRSK